MTLTPQQKQALDATLQHGFDACDNEMMRLALEKGAAPELLITEAWRRNRLAGTDIGLLSLALQKGAEPNLLLFAGIASQSLTVVKLAVETGHADVNAARRPSAREDSLPAAHWVNRYFKADIANYLLDKGMGVDVPDAQGATPLLCALRDSDLTRTTHYLQHGANPLVADKGGEFPLNFLQQLRLPSSWDRNDFQNNQDALLKAMLKNMPDDGGAAASLEKTGDAFNTVATRGDIAVGHPLELRTKTPAAEGNDRETPKPGGGLHL